MQGGRGALLIVKAIAVYVLVDDAPDRASRCGEEEFLNGDSENINSEKIWEIVIALNEVGVKEQKTQE